MSSFLLNHVDKLKYIYTPFFVNPYFYINLCKFESINPRKGEVKKTKIVKQNHYKCEHNIL